MSVTVAICVEILRIHKVKTKISFIYASTSLDTKTYTFASIRNFEGGLSIRRFAFQHIFRFLHFFTAGFSFVLSNFSYYFVVLLNVPLSD